ncbi:hypothetical protein ElyMa_001928700 [Elysia marginata]|uniref:Uncharacterized protein n=1 Tax=Elysia marginata TaxID=1093978 RepID=A0AAV4EU31_9GAST|nr:hypothetical protein ElyMa_001928700 [Elysia marginata]
MQNPSPFTNVPYLHNPGEIGDWTETFRIGDINIYATPELYSSYALESVPQKSNGNYEVIDSDFENSGQNTKSSKQLQYITDYESIDKIIRSRYRVSSISNKQEDVDHGDEAYNSEDYNESKKSQRDNDNILVPYNTGSESFRKSDNSMNNKETTNTFERNQYTRLASRTWLSQREGVSDSFLETYGPASGSSAIRYAPVDVDAVKINEYNTLASRRGLRRRDGISDSFLATYGPNSAGQVNQDAITSVHFSTSEPTKEGYQAPETHKTTKLVNDNLAENQDDSAINAQENLQSSYSCQFDLAVRYRKGYW